MTTSSEHPDECYVYVTLPDRIDLVTAGRFQLTIDRRGVPLGRFVYGRSYLERADSVAIDPVELKLSRRVYQTTVLNGVFGALRDAGPDYWGRRVIERHVGKPQLNEIDYLLYGPDDRAGALGFGLGRAPPVPRREFNRTLDLARLQLIADAVVKDEELPDGELTDQIEDLLLVGTSMGGARPKAVVEDEGGLWIAKFNRPDDKWNNARVEQAMLALARACGITAAESKVVPIAGRDVLLVKRFDREQTDRGYLRARMVSGLTLLRAEDSHRSRDRWSYLLLAEELRRVCAEPRKAARELFRRMCFNALISNIDDHPRNHAIVAKQLDWKLSPAYDLTPSTPVSLERRAGGPAHRRLVAAAALRRRPPAGAGRSEDARRERRPRHDRQASESGSTSCPTSVIQLILGRCPGPGPAGGATSDRSSRPDTALSHRLPGRRAPGAGRSSWPPAWRCSASGCTSTRSTTRSSSMTTARW